MALRFFAALALTLPGARAAAAGEVRGAGAVAVNGRLVAARISVGSRVDGLEGAVVWLEDAAPPGASTPATPSPPAQATWSMSQRNKSFQPEVLVVPRGATVTFLNDDVLAHNVFSPALGATFDLGIYAKGGVREFTFSTPGVFPVYCNIHPQMIGFIVVLPGGPWARPEADGRFVLRGVTPGKHTLLAWFRFGKPVRQEVDVPTTGLAGLEVVLQEQAGVGTHPDKSGKPYLPYSVSR